MSIRNGCATRASPSRGHLRRPIAELFTMKLLVVAGLTAGLALSLTIAGAADAGGRHAPRQTSSRAPRASGLLAMDGLTGGKGHGDAALGGLGGDSLTIGGGKGGGALAASGLSTGGKHGGGGDLSGLGGGKHGGGDASGLGGGGRHHAKHASGL
jgi:hypothetical protein